MPRQRHPYRSEQILRTAVELFHRQGFAQTSMDAIAGAVGIRTASIYHHFRDKGALLDAAIDRAQADLTSRLARSRIERDLAARMELLVDALVDHVVGDLALAAVARHDRAHASPAARRRAEKADALVLAAVEADLALLQADESKGAHRARAKALIGSIWSVTHADLDLAAPALRAYLQKAGRAAVFGRQQSKTSMPSVTSRRRSSSRGSV